MMNNKERYQKAFNTIEPSIDITPEKIMELKENRKMKKGKSGFKKTLVSLVAAVVLVIGVTGGAYAADLGGFRTNVDTWLYGEPVQVDIEEVGEGDFIVHYPNGVDRETGGIAYGPNGEPIAFTTEDVIASLDYPEIATIDGKTIIFYKNEQIDITEDVKDGKAEVTFKPGVMKLHVKVDWTDEDTYTVNTSQSLF